MIVEASGGSVRLVLGWIALPAALATLLWLPQARQTVRAVVPARVRGVAVYRYALAWQVTAFMGLQSLLYFATLSWLPTILRDRGATPESAGNLLSLMVLGNFAASLVPVVAQRLNGQRVLAVSAAAGLAAGLAGALYAPLGSAVAWVLILGVSQGAALALAIFFTIARAPDPVAQVQSSGVYRGDPAPPRMEVAPHEGQPVRHPEHHESRRRPPSWSPAPAGQYSHVARAELGDKTMLQLSGQAAIDADGTIVGGNDMGAQAEYIMDNITAILAAHGATLADVVNVRAYLTDMSQLPEYGKVRAARFTGTSPTVTTVEVSRLFVPSALLEVEVLAIA